MNEQLKKQYDSLYASQKIVFGAGKPVEAVCKLSNYISTGTVLDIGGGEGRNALYLAQKGFSVSVCDISEVGIEKLQKAAEEKKVHIETTVTDVSTGIIEGIYDSVVMSFVLHHLSAVDSLRLITMAQKHTSTNGVHILVTFMNKGDLHKRNLNSQRFYPNEESLIDLYLGWDIKELSTQEVTTHARDKHGKRMKNFVISLIAINNRKKNTL